MFKENIILLKDAVEKNMLCRIETFPCAFCKSAKDNSVIRIIFPEFTCVCPRTGYPDFASIDLYYLPDKRCIELKSWKLYLASFRMIGTFHEPLTAHLFHTVTKLLKPRWLLLVGDFFPRGNVNTTVAIETPGKRPECAGIMIKDYTPHCTSFEVKNRGKGFTK